MTRAWTVALVGAESTGKTTLARDIASALEARGQRVVVVDEALREFCALRGRTPHQDEQEGLAREQTRRIAEAAASEAIDVVVADTTALMIAVYSDFVFGDRKLYIAAEAAQALIDLTLLTALDLPWQADGLQRDGEHVRVPVDALVRAALERAGVAVEPVAGSGSDRLAAAMAAIDQARSRAKR
ncbi:MAG TPA: ATP-binding protein [Caldimonas sp.]|nr:ATP-binding protein [Caldimonas sp.]